MWTQWIPRLWRTADISTRFHQNFWISHAPTGSTHALILFSISTVHVSFDPTVQNGACAPRTLLPTLSHHYIDAATTSPPPPLIQSSISLFLSLSQSMFPVMVLSVSLTSPIQGFSSTTLGRVPLLRFGSCSDLGFRPKMRGSNNGLVVSMTGGNFAMTGVVFQPFEEVKNEEFMVPIVPHLSLARQRYADDCEAAINEQIKWVLLFCLILFPCQFGISSKSPVISAIEFMIYIFCPFSFCFLFLILDVKI